MYTPDTNTIYNKYIGTDKVCRYVLEKYVYKEIFFFHFHKSIISMSPCSNFMAIGKSWFSGSPVVSTNFPKGPKLSSSFFLMSWFMQVCMVHIFLHFLNFLTLTYCSGRGISAKNLCGKDCTTWKNEIEEKLCDQIFD